MNSKNLGLKFLFVAMLMVFSAVVLYTWKLPLGIDLAGGTTLTYEIIHEPGEDVSQDRERTIEILKQRVDPTGLASLEWRPVGKDRFEVRMRIGDPKVQEKRKALEEAMNALDKGNLQHRDIVSYVDATPERRPAILKQLNPEEATAAKLQKLAQVADQEKEYTKQLASKLSKRQELISAGAAAEATSAPATAPATTGPAAASPAAPSGPLAAIDKEISALQDKLDNASITRLDLQEQLRKTSLARRDMQGILDQYVPASEARGLNAAQLEQRNRPFEDRISLLKLDHPSRSTQIDNVVSAYKEMAKYRMSLSDPEDLKRLISKAGQLTFRIAPSKYPSNEPGNYSVSPSDLLRVEESLNKEGPDGLKRRGDRFGWYAIHGDETYDGLITQDFAGKTYVLLAGDKDPEHTLLRITKKVSAWPSQDQNGSPAVHFGFDAETGERFGQLTGNNINKQMATLLDDEVYTAPNIKSKITDSGEITGRFTRAEVDQIVRILNAGALQKKLNPTPVAESTFAASLGEDNLHLATNAAIACLIAIGAFMIIYYHRAGFIADFAMMLNLLFMMGAMSLMNAVLTLPGLAGIILSIGMAVDSNVLIYERLREEQAKGQSIRMAVKNAYERAFRAILDSHVTTLLTCVILGWVGTPEVRGFAITLGLGVLFNLFTAVLVTHWIFNLMLDKGWLTKPMSMLHFIRVPKIDWMSKRYWFWGFSLATLILGLLALGVQAGKKEVWGIEFTGGTKATLVLADDALAGPNHDKLPTDGDIRAELMHGDKPVLPDLQVTIIKPSQRVEDFIAAHGDKAKNGEVTLEKWKRDKLNPKVFEMLGGKNGVLVPDELRKALSSNTYPSNTYEVTTTDRNKDEVLGELKKVFGDRLVLRKKVDFTLAQSSPLPEIGPNVAAAPNGMTRITPAMEKDSRFTDTLSEYEGGVMFVLKDVSPAATKEEIQQRIREMRFQPDTPTDLRLNRSEVIGLSKTGEAGEGADQTFTSFAIMVQPDDIAKVEQTQKNWDDFAVGERGLLENALQREGTIPTINFDASIAGQTSWSAIMALIIGWAVIILYLWVRFGQLSWGLGAVICLIHDVTIMVGLVAISGWVSEHMPAISSALLIEPFKIDLMMITALLTIIGYSVSDTIVVFDRIRENRGKLVHLNEHVINSSINQTLARTLITSGTVFVVVFIMYVWGGPGIHSFNYALLAGVFFGTYSSIAVASPILLGFKGAVIRHFDDKPASAPAAPIQK
jgi:SecD/SecF fusion protein